MKKVDSELILESHFDAAQSFSDTVHNFSERVFSIQVSLHLLASYHKEALTIFAILNCLEVLGSVEVTTVNIRLEFNLQHKSTLLEVGQFWIILYLDNMKIILF